MSYATTADGEVGLPPEAVTHLQERGLLDTTAKALGSTRQAPVHLSAWSSRMKKTGRW